MTNFFYQTCLFVFAGIEALAGVFAIWDRRRRKLATPIPDANTNLASLAIIALAIGFVLSIFAGVYARVNPIRPVVETKIVERTIEKTIPCPPPLPATKTGPATFKGNNGVANSGSIGTLSQGATQNPKQKGKQ